MKFNRDNKVLSYSIATFLVIAAAITFYYLLTNFRTLIGYIGEFLVIIAPIIYGFVIAFFLNPVVKYFESKIFHVEKRSEKNKKRLKTLSIIITYVLFGALVYGFFRLVIPELSNSIKNIINSSSTYEKNAKNWFNKVAAKNPVLSELFGNNYNELVDKLNNFVNANILPKINEYLMTLTTGVFSALKIFLNLVVGIIVSIYLIFNKDLMLGQCKKLIYAVMRRSTANNFIHNIRFTNKTFMNFFIGKIADSIIIGLICYIVMSIMQLEYAALISVIIGITNIIPLFGPFIGAIPSAVLIFMVSPKGCLEFIIMVIILQQFDGNILGPKILGSSTGLSGFWVIFAITLFGGWFGLLGWLVGVPIFAVFYTGLKSYVNARLADKKLETDTAKYKDVNFIDREHNYIKIPEEDVYELASEKGNILQKIKSLAKNRKEDGSLEGDAEDTSSNNEE